MKKKVRIILGVLMAMGFLMPSFSQAQFFQGGDAENQTPTGFTKYFGEADIGDPKDQRQLEQTLPIAIGKIIRQAMAYISVIMLLFVTYAGFLWMMARGESEQVVKAKTIMRNAIIGLVITASAFILTSFVVSRLQSAILGDATQVSVELTNSFSRIV